MIALITLTLGVWHGASLASAPATAARYKLAVHGAPRKQVRLRAANVPKGWLVAFCTPAFCAPFSYNAILDRRGAATLELTLLRIEPNAPRRIRVIIAAPGARPVEVRR